MASSEILSFTSLVQKLLRPQSVTANGRAALLRYFVSNTKNRLKLGIWSVEVK